MITNLQLDHHDVHGWPLRSVRGPARLGELPVRCWCRARELRTHALHDAFRHRSSRLHPRVRLLPGVQLVHHDAKAEDIYRRRDHGTGLEPLRREVRQSSAGVDVYGEALIVQQLHKPAYLQQYQSRTLESGPGSTVFPIAMPSAPRFSSPVTPMHISR